MKWVTGTAKVQRTERSAGRLKVFWLQTYLLSNACKQPLWRTTTLYRAHVRQRPVRAAGRNGSRRNLPSRAVARDIETVTKCSQDA